MISLRHCPPTKKWVTFARRCREVQDGKKSTPDVGIHPIETNWVRLSGELSSLAILRFLHHLGFVGHLVVIE